ncbi:T2R40 protein, partial [Formicarius rufipectus]|nr:T2R40 protein [Formicarius rufipectus]
FLSVIYPKYLYVQPSFQLVLSIKIFLSFSNIWGSACLFGFYCIKIANFTNSFFIYLKVKIDRIVPWLLLGSVFSSLLIGIFVYNVTNNDFSKKLNFTCPGIIWRASAREEELFFFMYLLIGFGFVTSFVAVIFSALLLLFSLWRHKRNMQTNSMRDLSMEAHIKAMKSILSFLVMYSINFAILILTLTYTVGGQNHLMFFINVFLGAFPSVHSLILICSNPKLEKSLLRILFCVKCKVCMK